MSRILNTSPFSDTVQELTIPQMDFILEMFAKDNPDEWSFKRGATPQIFMDRMKAWEQVLTPESFKNKKLWPKGKPVLPNT